MGQSWTFTRKLAAGFGTMLVLVMLLGAVAVNAMQGVSAQLDLVTAGHVPHVVEAARLEASAEQDLSTFRGFLLTGDQKSLDNNVAARAELGTRLERLRSSELETAQGRAALGSVATVAEEYHRIADTAIAARKSGKQVGEIEQMMESSGLPLARKLRSEIEAYERMKIEQVQRDSAQFTASARRSLSVVVGVALGIIALCIALAVLLTRGLSRQVGTAVHKIESASTELQAAANQQSAGIKEQSAALTEITTTLNELLSSSRQIAESSQSVSRIAGETSHASSAGEAGMDRATGAVGGIRAEVDRIVEHMLELGRKSQQVGGIVDVINELSEQTNILAINATIEAVGAGEQGVRFGAVAEEIRKLATRVGNATKEIRGLVEQIRTAVSSAVMATETGSKTVDAGQARIKEVTEQFNRIAGMVETTTEAAREIELSTKQQTSAVEQVNVAITNVSQAARETSASASQTLQTARELVTLSGELARLVRAPVRA